MADHPLWTLFNIEAAFRPERAEGIDAVVEFHAGEAVFHFVIRRQACRGVTGPATQPDITIRSASDHLLGDGARLQVQGDPAVFDRVRPCFDL